MVFAHFHPFLEKKNCNVLGDNSYRQFFIQENCQYIKKNIFKYIFKTFLDKIYNVKCNLKNKEQ